MNRYWLAILIIILGLSIVHAAEITTTPQIQTELAITRTESTLERPRGLWQLSHDEWQRYETLMQGIRGRLSTPQISPLEVLGIHARSDDERRHYADRWAQLLFEDTERVLAFEQAYRQAFRQHFPNAKAIDISRQRQTTPPPQTNQSAAETLTIGDRLLFFTATTCAVCDHALTQLMTVLTQRPGVGLDIYLTDTDASKRGDADVRAWAQTQAIPPTLVSQRRITLNHANGLDAEFSSQPLPVILRQRNGVSQPLPLLGTRP